MGSILNNIEIKEISKDYKGITIINNKKCFIDNVIIGDIVDIGVYKETSKYYLAKVINFIKKSNDRIEYKCEYNNCGGCDFECVSEEYYYKIKSEILYSNIIKNFPYFNKENLNIFKVGYGKRRRITLNYANGAFGFFEKESNNIVHIKKCLNVVEDINLIIEKLDNLKLPNLSSLDITKIDNGIILNFNFSNSFNINELKKIEFLKPYSILISYCINQSTPIRYFIKEEPILKLGNKNIIIPEKCFLQATKESQDFMIDTVCKNLEGFKKIADLYCGVGTYSFPLSEKSKVFSFEGDELMVNSINKNSFKTKIVVSKRDLFKQPLICSELNKFDGIVINPPRNGAENQCKFIAKSKVKKIIYISCSLEAFIRDTKLLTNKYKLTNLYMIDQFYMSKHFEIIGVFEQF